MSRRAYSYAVSSTGSAPSPSRLYAKPRTKASFRRASASLFAELLTWPPASGAILPSARRTLSASRLNAGSTLVVGTG